MNNSSRVIPPKSVCSINLRWCSGVIASHNCSRNTSWLFSSWADTTGYMPCKKCSTKIGTLNWYLASGSYLTRGRIASKQAYIMMQSAIDDFGRCRQSTTFIWWCRAQISVHSKTKPIELSSWQHTPAIADHHLWDYQTASASAPPWCLM